MKALLIFIAALILFPPSKPRDPIKEAAFLNYNMIPLARKFVERNGLPPEDFSTTNMLKHSVDFFQDGRPGCIASLTLKDRSFFWFRSDGTNTHVWFFHDGQTKTYYNLVGAQPQKIEAIKSLLAQNKLNDKTALELVKKYLRLQGHKEENYHSPEFQQSGWIGGELGGKTNTWGRLPYYEARWYRKDVTQQQRESGLGLLPCVRIEVSGITSNLVSYEEEGLPIGGDY